jgi:hypothetical protein
MVIAAEHLKIARDLRPEVPVAEVMNVEASTRRTTRVLAPMASELKGPEPHRTPVSRAKIDLAIPTASTSAPKPAPHQ